MKTLETIPGTSGIGRGGALLSSPADSPHEAHGDPESVVATLASWLVNPGRRPVLESPSRGPCLTMPMDQFVALFWVIVNVCAKKNRRELN